MILTPIGRKPWALSLDHPFNYLQMGAAKVVAENEKPLLIVCFPDQHGSRVPRGVVYPTDVPERARCWDRQWPSSCACSSFQEETQTWYLGHLGKKKQLWKMFDLSIIFIMSPPTLCCSVLRPAVGVLCGPQLNQFLHNIFQMSAAWKGVCQEHSSPGRPLTFLSYWALGQESWFQPPWPSAVGLRALGISGNPHWVLNRSMLGEIFLQMPHSASLHMLN